MKGGLNLQKNGTFLVTIHDMRESYYVIFCHSKKQLVIVFRGGKHNRNWLVLVSKDYVMGVAHIMNVNSVKIYYHIITQ